ncbi:MAG: DEAD/DEAH box helicase [bacterium]
MRRESTIKSKKEKSSAAAAPKTKKLSRTHKPEDMTVEQWQVELRRQFGREQNFLMENIGDHPVFSDFAITNPATRKTYRVVIRGDRIGLNYCSCPDFSVNTLGTCKHIEFTLAMLEKDEQAVQMLRAGYVPPFSEIRLQYGARRRVLFLSGKESPRELAQLADRYFDHEGFLHDDAFIRFDAFLEEARRFDPELRCYDDALALVAEKRDAEHRRAVVHQRYLTNGGEERMNTLLKVALYPYQREGALFAAQAGRALIADDMGLGKTIQAIAAAEIMAREFGVEKALIVCPTSLKYQWKYEIEKFCDRSALVIEGLLPARRKLYQAEAFFKIINYEMLSRDLEIIMALSPDLIILDEAQRIKNWKTRTAQCAKQIQSDYAIVLTGTPLENRLEELHSIVEFVDRYKLGPLFRFLANHQITDQQTGRAVGYQNLKSIGETLAPILLRRTKKEVLQQLPERMDKNFFVPMTQKQREYHDENRDIVARIVAKWRRYKFLSEADQRRLMVALQYMRMACDNTYLIDQETCHGPKLDELLTLLQEIFEQTEAKVVIFSQWQRMNDLVAQMLNKNSIPFVYLHGGVPGAKRKDLISAFRDDSAIRAFLSTDAGGTGLNLQAASTIINMDLPWNPAVLEQRIGRVHRIGQHRPVQVVNFVSEGTIEHGMLDVLTFKKSVLAGVLDGGEDTVFMGGTRLNKFMESVEVVSQSIPETACQPPELPEPPSSALSSTSAGEEKAAEKDKQQRAAKPRADLEPLLEAGAAFLKELGTLATKSREQGKSPLASFFDTDEKTGKPCLKIPMPDPKVVEGVISALGPLFNMFSGNR